MENTTKNKTGRNSSPVESRQSKLAQKIFSSSEIEKHHYQFKFGRKLVHTSFSLFGFAILFAPIEYKNYILTFIYTLFLLSFIADTLRICIPFLNKLTYKYLGSFFIKRDQNRYSSGTYYLLGASIACILYSYHVAGMSIIFLGIGDFMASLAGTYLKKIIPFKLPYSHKTLVGLLAFIIVTTFIGICAGIPFIPCFTASTAAALAEVYITKIDDNLIIPVVGGAVLTIFLNGIF